MVEFYLFVADRRSRWRLTIKSAISIKFSVRMSWDDFIEQFTDLSINHLINTSIFSFSKTWNEVYKVRLTSMFHIDILEAVLQSRSRGAEIKLPPGAGAEPKL
jgi:hypothetical protein